MDNLKFLDSKEKKLFLRKLKDQFDFSVKIEDNLLRSDKGKIFLISKDVSKVDFKDLRVNSVGMYLGRDDKEIRLSIEGSQLIGPKAKKNVHPVNEREMENWMAGDEIDCNEEYEGFVILKYNDDFIGCGKYSNRKILNYVPKERRIKFR